MEERLTLKEYLKLKIYYFSLQSSWGLTKHMGGLKVTKEVIELCHISKNSYILDSV